MLYKPYSHGKEEVTVTESVMVSGRHSGIQKHWQWLGRGGAIIASNRFLIHNQRFIGFPFDYVTELLTLFAPVQTFMLIKYYTGDEV